MNYVDRNVFYHSPPAPRVADCSFIHTNYANAVKAPVGPRYPVSHVERSRNWNSPRGFSPSQGRRVTFSPVQSVKEFHEDSILEKQLVPTPMMCCPVKPVHSPEFDSHIHSTNVVDDEKGWTEVRPKNRNQCSTPASSKGSSENSAERSGVDFARLHAVNDYWNKEVEKKKAQATNSVEVADERVFETPTNWEDLYRKEQERIKNLVAQRVTQKAQSESSDTTRRQPPHMAK